MESELIPGICFGEKNIIKVLVSSQYEYISLTKIIPGILRLQFFLPLSISILFCFIPFNLVQQHAGLSQIQMQKNTPVLINLQLLQTHAKRKKEAFVRQFTEQKTRIWEPQHQETVSERIAEGCVMTKLNKHCKIWKANELIFSGTFDAKLARIFEIPVNYHV